MTAARWTNGILGLWLAVALSVAATPLAGQAPAVGTREVTPMLTHLLALGDGTLPASGGGAREVLHLSAATLDVLHRTKVPFQPHQSARAAAVR